MAARERGGVVVVTKGSDDLLYIIIAVLTTSYIQLSWGFVYVLCVLCFPCDTSLDIYTGWAPL